MYIAKHWILLEILMFILACIGAFFIGEFVFVIWFFCAFGFFAVLDEIYNKKKNR